MYDEIESTNWEGGSLRQDNIRRSKPRLILHGTSDESLDLFLDAVRKVDTGETELIRTTSPDAMAKAIRGGDRFLKTNRSDEFVSAANLVERSTAVEEGTQSNPASRDDSFGLDDVGMRRKRRLQAKNAAQSPTRTKKVKPSGQTEKAKPSAQTKKAKARPIRKLAAVKEEHGDRDPSTAGVKKRGGAPGRWEERIDRRRSTRKVAKPLDEKEAVDGEGRMAERPIVPPNEDVNSPSESTTRATFKVTELHLNKLLIQGTFMPDNIIDSALRLVIRDVVKTEVQLISSTRFHQMKTKSSEDIERWFTESTKASRPLSREAPVTIIEMNDGGHFAFVTRFYSKKGDEGKASLHYCDSFGKSMEMSAKTTLRKAGLFSRKDSWFSVSCPQQESTSNDCGAFTR
jgi:hypothetical protein